MCWMYASAGAVEQYVSKKYGSKFDISESHGAVAISNSIYPNNPNSSGFYPNQPDYGGNEVKALQYFTNWNTPIFDEDVCNWKSTVSEFSYPITKITEPVVNLIDNDFLNSDSLLNVTDAHYVNVYDQVAIKKSIKEYGGVVTGIVSNNNYGEDSNGEKNLYIGTSTSKILLGHEIMIIGWDDNYSKDNFKQDNKPTIDGAWLVRNSYDNANYYWLSYQEGSLKAEDNNMIAIAGVQKATDNEYMLSYDYLVPEYNKTDKNYYFNDDVYFCNVFDISTYTNTYNKINKVMFYAKTNTCNYEIKIVQLGNNGALPSNLDNYSALATGTCNGEGYVTATLNNPYYFTSNNKCAVIVKLSPISTSTRIYIPYEGVFYRGLGKPIITPEINSGESYFSTAINDNGIVWNDCFSDTTYGDSNHKGNLIIRPILNKKNITPEEVTVTPNKIMDNNNDVNIQISTNTNLFNIHTASNYILRQDVDYIRTNTGITLKSNYINSLNGAYTELVLEFSNDTTKIVVVNPKSMIIDVTVTGKPIIGDTLTATCVGDPEKNQYDVNYQWQSSSNEQNWYNISDATSNTYTITDNDINRFIRVKVTAKQFGNVEYPTEKFSSSTVYKVVLLGDIDLDGTVTVNDAMLLSKYLAEMVTLTERQLLTADANKDNHINVNDVRRIQEIAMGM